MSAPRPPAPRHQTAAPRSALPEVLLRELRPIDAAAFDGGYKLVFSGTGFSLARWDGGRWAYVSGRALDFEPVSYRP